MNWHTTERSDSCEYLKAVGLREERPMSYSWAAQHSAMGRAWRCEPSSKACLATRYTGWPRLRSIRATTWPPGNPAPQRIELPAGSSGCEQRSSYPQRAFLSQSGKVRSNKANASVQYSGPSRSTRRLKRAGEQSKGRESMRISKAYMWLSVLVPCLLLIATRAGLFLNIIYASEP